MSFIAAGVVILSAGAVIGAVVESWESDVVIADEIESGEAK